MVKSDKDSMLPLLKQTWVVSGVVLNLIEHGCIHGFPAIVLDRACPELHIPRETTGSWIVSSAGITLVMGTLVVGWIVNRWGRRRGHQLGLLPALAGWALFGMADSMAWLLVARLLHGVALGMRTPVAAPLVGEYASPRYRTIFLSTIALSLALGMLFSHFVGDAIPWRHSALVCGVFQLLALIIITLSPESPSWLANKGKHLEAARIFRWLRRPSEERELDILIKSQALEIKSKNAQGIQGFFKKYATIFSKKELYKSMIIIYCTFLSFEFGGMHIVPSYARKIFDKMLIDKSYVDFCVYMIDVIRVVGTVCALGFMRLFKRRTLLFASGGLTVIHLLSFAAYLLVKENKIFVFETNMIPLTLFTSYMFFFSAGMLPMTWTLTGEIFPLAHKTLGTTSACVSFAFNLFMSLKTAPALFATFGMHGAYVVYSLIVTGGLLVLWFILPETKGRLLQEIECELRGETIKDIEARAAQASAATLIAQ